eukprot:XP_011428419.1 PREDICTED: perlucin isoform X1 [Crassostrea gigas]
MKKHFFLFIYLVFGTSGISADCPDNWIRFADSCYLFMTRYPMQWIEAMTFCKTFDAKLAEVETHPEDTFIRHEARVYGAYKESFWIGGNDLISEGKWMWMTSHTPLHYTNWAHGEPSNEFGGEHCMSLLFYTDYHWNDERCKTVLPFICEKETSSPALGMLVG